MKSAFMPGKDRSKKSAGGTTLPHTMPVSHAKGILRVASNMGRMENNGPGVALQLWDMVQRWPKTFKTATGWISAECIQVEPPPAASGAAHEQIPQLVLVIIPTETLDTEGVFAKTYFRIVKMPLQKRDETAVWIERLRSVFFREGLPDLPGQSVYVGGLVKDFARSQS